MNGDLSFERDMKPLFRESDRATMLSIANFDLWRRDDVATNSQAILERLGDGSMPCDRPGRLTALTSSDGGSTPACPPSTQAMDAAEMSVAGRALREPFCLIFGATPEPPEADGRLNKDRKEGRR